jgi:hypothetical protein
VLPASRHWRGGGGVVNQNQVGPCLLWCGARGAAGHWGGLDWSRLLASGRGSVGGSNKLSISGGDA